MTMKIKILSILLISAVSVRGMDRFAALSQIESGDNDNAVGRDGEVSRYQIMPSVWRHYTALPLDAARNPSTARRVAEAIMRDRCGTPPNGFELTYADATWYLLWHRPATCAAFHHLRSATAREADRAQRFANLCQRP